MTSRLIVNSIRHTGGSADAVTLASDGTCTANITNNLSNRNLIINGDMRIAQRGTSSTSSSFQTVDRFAYDRNNTGAATQSQVADAPEGFKYSYKIDCTTAETSPAANVYNLISQKFEGQNLQHIKKGTSNAQSLTASFYVKGNAAATYTCELRDQDNTRFNSQTFNVTTSWSRVTLTFAPDTTGAFDSDNNLSLYLFFWLSSGSDYSSGTFSSNTWHTTDANRIGDGQTNFFDSTDRTFFLTGVQLEVGSVATDFEHLSFADELRRCQRYYFKTFDYSVAPAQNTSNYNGSLAGGASVTNVSFAATQVFPVAMRAAPTVTTFSPDDSSSEWSLQGGKTPTAQAFSQGMTSVTIRGVTNTSNGGLHRIHIQAVSEL
tara:strand:- start:2029 stop:3156 length:1128 start_codon:yes stop_codon:yes gene_type:complete